MDQQAGKATGADWQAERPERSCRCHAGVRRRPSRGCLPRAGLPGRPPPPSRRPWCRPRLTTFRCGSHRGGPNDSCAPVPVPHPRISGATAGPLATMSGAEVASPSGDRSAPTATRAACRRTRPARYPPAMCGPSAATPSVPCRPYSSSGADRTARLPLRGGAPGESGARLPDATTSATGEGGRSEDRDRADLRAAHHA
jgi:hypothetical protein